jgi:hypothetical protein
MDLERHRLGIELRVERDAYRPKVAARKCELVRVTYVTLPSQKLRQITGQRKSRGSPPDER